MSELSLVDFLLARFDEDEAVARLATRGPWDAVEGSSGAWWVELQNLADVALDLHGENAAHIARHDPARVLVEVESKRRIVGIHSGPQYGREHAHLCYDSMEDDNDCETLHALALVYADHEDYRAEEWAP